MSTLAKTVAQLRNTSSDDRLSWPLIWILMVALGLSALALGQRVDAAEACCAISAIDAKNSLVTAREAATGRSFQFKAGGAKLLGSLKVGQKVSADFETQMVSVDGKMPCCLIVQAPMKAR